MDTSITTGTAHQRRAIRMRRSALVDQHFADVDQAIVKRAETRDELEQALSLVYREYLRQGYIAETNASKIYSSIYHILPETAVHIWKSQLTVSGTVTQIFDSRLFGLPMDGLYHDELNALRDANRKLSEISALAISGQVRWCNLFMYLFRAVYRYARVKKVTDFCIMVNPKHVDFYKAILLFEDLGPERYYPRVSAPAVALRLNLEDIEDKFREAYSAFHFDRDLHSFFFGESDSPMIKRNRKYRLETGTVLDADMVRYFFAEKTKVLENIPPKQMNYIQSVYPGL